MMQGLLASHNVEVSVYPTNFVSIGYARWFLLNKSQSEGHRYALFMDDDVFPHYDLIRSINSCIEELQKAKKDFSFLQFTRMNFGNTRHFDGGNTVTHWMYPLKAGEYWGDNEGIVPATDIDTACAVVNLKYWHPDDIDPREFPPGIGGEDHVLGIKLRLKHLALFVRKIQYLHLCYDTTRRWTEAYRYQTYLSSKKHSGDLTEYQDIMNYETLIGERMEQDKAKFWTAMLPSSDNRDLVYTPKKKKDKK
jgi:hypothetical protein